MAKPEHIRGRVAPLLAALTVLGLALSSGLAQPAPALAAAPDVRYVSPSGVAVDGSAADWDRGADFLADMFEAGKPDKRILSTSYARYDCATGTMYVFVEAVPDWVILPSDSDNYVKIGNSQKLVDGSYGANGTPPDFRYIGSTGWEASFQLAEGTYDGPTGLNIHAEVAPESMRATSAVALRALTVVIDCSQAPQPRHADARPPRRRPRPSRARPGCPRRPRPPRPRQRQRSPRPRRLGRPRQRPKRRRLGRPRPRRRPTPTPDATPDADARRDADPGRHPDPGRNPDAHARVDPGARSAADHRRQGQRPGHRGPIGRRHREGRRVRVPAR